MAMYAVQINEDLPFIQQFIDFLQRKHRVDILLFLHDHGITQWGDAKASPQVTATDESFRRACRHLCMLGMAEAIPIDPAKNKYRLTSFGCLVADVVKRALTDIEILATSEYGPKGRK